MLAAAHILAMDAKNLLDVVDCIRERHPHIDWRAALLPPDQPPAPPGPPAQAGPPAEAQVSAHTWLYLHVLQHGKLFLFIILYLVLILKRLNFKKLFVVSFYKETEDLWTI